MKTTILLMFGLITGTREAPIIYAIDVMNSEIKWIGKKVTGY